MNKELLYDLAKLLKRYSPGDIAEIAAFLRDPHRVSEALSVIASLEVLSKELKQKKPKKKITPKTSEPDSGFKGISDAILQKEDANKARMATPTSPSVLDVSS